MPSPSRPRWVREYIEAVAANEELTAVDARAWWGSSSQDEEVDFEEGKDTAVTSSTASVGSWGAWMDRGGLQEGAVITC